jgi:hypothetical protein
MRHETGNGGVVDTGPEVPAPLIAVMSAERVVNLE